MKSGKIIDTLSCYILMIFTLLYYSQGLLISGSEGVGQALLSVILLISMAYLIKMIFAPKKFIGFMKVWLLFIVMYCFYYLLYANFTQFKIIKGVLFNFLPFFPFYYFSENKTFTRRHLILFFLLILPIFIIKFNRSLAELKFERETEDVVDNTIYLFIGLLPFIFLFRQKIISFLFLMIIWYFTLQSAKRGAILCCAATMGLLMYEYLRSAKGRYKILKYVVSVSLVVAIGYLGYDFYKENEYVLERMQLMLEGGSSGRDSLIEDLVGTWYGSNNLIRYFFGFGYNASRLHSIHVSHNDWVDMLISFGLLGLVVFFTLFRLMIKEAFNKSWSKDKKIILVSVICIAIIVSLTSRWYWSPFAFMQYMILPYLLATGKEEMQNREKHSPQER